MSRLIYSLRICTIFSDNMAYATIGENYPVHPPSLNSHMFGFLGIIAAKKQLGVTRKCHRSIVIDQSMAPTD